MEIKFVAKKLCKLLSNGDIAQQYTDVNTSDKIDHNDLITKNFWGYVKRFFKEKCGSLPTFDRAQCTVYFKETFSAILNPPITPFNIDHPPPRPMRLLMLFVR